MTETGSMTVDLSGRTFRIVGGDGIVSQAVSAALIANGASPAEGSADLVIISQTLLPEGYDEVSPTFAANAVVGREMAGKTGGRLIFLLSALAGLPMRRHPEYSVAMAAAVAGMRLLAMQLAPYVLVNAIGAGVIEGEGGALLSGDRRMLTHASLGRPGSLADLTNAVLFLCDPLNSYTTGQLLTVDGGWSVGYGRNF